MIMGGKLKITAACCFSLQNGLYAFIQLCSVCHPCVLYDAVCVCGASLIDAVCV